MNVLSARIALRHRSLLDVFDLALRFLFAHPAQYAALSALVLVPCFVANLVIATRSGYAWGWVFAVGVASVAEVPFTLLGSRLVFEEEVRLERVLVTALRVMPRVIAGRIVQVLAIAIGASFFFLPSIWIASILVFYVEVMVLEGAKVSTGLTRAQRLVAGEFGEALMTLLLVAGLQLAAVVLGDSALRTILEEIFQITAPPSMWEEGGGVLALVAFWLYVPFGATARLLCYLNVRTRTEGWDVQTRFAAIAQELARGAEDRPRAGVDRASAEGGTRPVERRTEAA